MAMLLATFRARFPEFVAVGDARVEAALADSLSRTDSTGFGDDADAAQGLLAAHLLAMGPGGQTARQEGNDKARTSYLEERQRLARARFGGPRLARP